MSATTYVPKPPMENKVVVRIYIDNSNLWIEGRKTYAKKKGLDTKTDPTWRFDVGRLKTTLLKKITLPGENIEVQANLYGSRPLRSILCGKQSSATKSISTHRNEAHGQEARKAWTSNSRPTLHVKYLMIITPGFQASI
ncbi:hypothetical protein BJX96DRAFT_11650 [Aspergillus floccosus]